MNLSNGNLVLLLVEEIGEQMTFKREFNHSIDWWCGEILVY